MKAIAVFPKEKRVALIEHPEPNIEKSTQVKIQILEVGVCGTDHEICEFKYGAPPRNAEYLILGHESLARVVAVGEDVADFQLGDLVVSMVRHPCSHATCLACRSHAQDFCYTSGFTEHGINGIHGFMTEYVVVEESFLHRVTKQLIDIAVLTEPLTIAEKAIREICFIQKRLPWDLSKQKQTALVIGAGPVGLLAAHVFLQHGFDVTVYSLEESTDFRANIAAALGARYVSAKEKDITALQGTFSKEADVIFDGSGASKLAFDLMTLLGYNGIFVWTGIPGRKETIDVNAGSIMRNIVLKNQSIVGSVNACSADFKNAIHNLSALHECVRRLPVPIVARYPVEAYADLLLKSPNANSLKSVIQFST